jgi:hypothetical protein
MNNYILPQSASSAITTNLRKDELASLQSTNDVATSRQRPIQTGNSIPIVFCSYISDYNIGGVWIAPPAARIGVQYKESDISSFSFGLILGDGQMPAVSANDIQQGSTSIVSLPSSSAVTTYSGLANAGFDYTLTYESSATPGTGTPGKYILSTAASVRPNNYDIVFLNPYTPSYESNRFTTLETWSSSTIPLNAAGERGYLVGTQVGYITYLEVCVEDASALGVPVSAGVRFEIDGAAVQTHLISDPAPVGAYKLTTSTGTPLPTPGNTVIVYIKVAEYEAATGGELKVAFRHRTLDWLYEPASSDYTPGLPAVSVNVPLFPGSGGTFNGLTTLSVKGDYAIGIDNSSLYQQIRCFVRDGLIVDKVLGGTGSSNLFPDLAYYLLSQVGKTIEPLIDKTSFEDAARFNTACFLTFNGILANSSNLRDYLSKLAPFYLLQFVQSGGRYLLKPLLPLEGNYLIDMQPISPVASFSNENIVAGSYRKEYTSSEMLRPFCAVMTWRSQSSASFPISQALEVRYEGSAIEGPFEQYDMEEFCTDARHAEIIGRYIISSRKNTKYSLSFETTAQSSTLLPTDIIQVTWAYESGGSQRQVVQLCQIESVFETQQGVYRIEAVHFPVDNLGRSLVALDMQNILNTSPPENVTPPSSFADTGTWHAANDPSTYPQIEGEWSIAGTSRYLYLRDIDAEGNSRRAQFNTFVGLSNGSIWVKQIESNPYFELTYKIINDFQSFASIEYDNQNTDNYGILDTTKPLFVSFVDPGPQPPLDPTLYWIYTPSAVNADALASGQFKIEQLAGLYYVTLNRVDASGVDRSSILNNVAVNDFISFLYASGASEIGSDVLSAQQSTNWVRFGIDNLSSIFTDGEYVKITASALKHSLRLATFVSSPPPSAGEWSVVAFVGGVQPVFNGTDSNGQNVNSALTALDAAGTSVLIRQANAGSAFYDLGLRRIQNYAFPTDWSYVYPTSLGVPSLVSGELLIKIYY